MAGRGKEGGFPLPFTMLNLFSYQSSPVFSPQLQATAKDQGRLAGKKLPFHRCAWVSWDKVHPKSFRGLKFPRVSCSCWSGTAEVHPWKGEALQPGPSALASSCGNGKRARGRCEPWAIQCTSQLPLCGSH